MPLDSQKQNSKNKIRLHKYLALCGFGSRRACERMVDAERVSVDKHTVRRQGVCIDPLSNVVLVDGKRVVPEEKVTILLNKPRDFLCTSVDPQGRRTFMSLLPKLSVRVYTVGRLDRNSEGLLIVTNDGDLANVLTHPRHQVQKEYHAWISKRLTDQQEQKIKRGILSRNETLRLDDLTLLLSQPENYVYRIRLMEGKNRHIRRVFEAIGVDIVRLKRVVVGPLKLGHLRSGGWRYLEDHEIEMLKNCVVGKPADN